MPPSARAWPRWRCWLGLHARPFPVILRDAAGEPVRPGVLRWDCPNCGKCCGVSVVDVALAPHPRPAVRRP